MPKQLLAEKYRPHNIEGYIFPSDIIKDKVTQWIEEQDIPNLMLISPPGRGKCITGDSLILGETGFSYIRDFSEGNDGFIPYERALYGDDGFNNSSHFYEETVDDIYKVTDVFGNEIKGTYEHPVKVFNTVTGKAEWCRLGDIKTGDTLVMMYNTQAYPSDYISFPDWTYEKSLHDGKSKDVTSKTLDESQGELFGFLVANGIVCRDNSGEPVSFNFSTHKKEVADRVTYLCDTLGLSHSAWKNNKIGLGGIQFYRYSIDNVFVHGFHTARYKYVPHVIMNSPKSVQCAFLRALIDSDGYMNDSGSIEYYTASHTLAVEVQNMLLNMGIVTTKKKKWNKTYERYYYTLVVLREFAGFYLETVGSQKYSYTDKAKNSNKFLAWGVHQYIQNWRDQLVRDYGVSANGVYHYNGIKRTTGGFSIQYPFKKQIGYSKVDDAIQNCLPDMDVPKVVELYENLTAIMESTDKFHSSVASVEKLEGERVYDFHIPNNHSFYSNGFLSHNTTLSRILVNELGVDPSDVKSVNASLTSGVGFIREELEPWIRKRGFGPLKIVQLEEMDRMTPDAQKALRQVSEEHTDRVRFICTANYENSIIDAMHSRFQFIKMDDMQYDDVLNYICDIVDAEELSIEDDDDILTHIDTYFPDVRKIINSIDQHTDSDKKLHKLETASYAGDASEWKDLWKNGNVTDNDFVPMFELAEYIDMNNYEWFYEVMYNNHHQFSDPQGAIVKLSNYLDRAQRSANQRLHLKACLYHIFFVED